MGDEEQGALFEMPEPWKEAWSGMPEFESADMKPFDAINVQFRNLEDKQAFLRLLGENPSRVQTIWYPQLRYLRQSEVAAAPRQVTQNTYPIYVISKGRWEQRLTARALEKLGIAYHIVVEPQEFSAYAAVLDARRILTLPFSNLGQGSIPARNWVWEHALTTGATRHWILDDNMDGFYRMHQNMKRRVTDENPFTPIEQFADRYQNVALAGMQYEFFADRRSKWAPFALNTRIYSCILIRNDLPYRWRGRYNEDTDLSLRALKDGWCTVLFNAFLCMKLTTMTIKGGNTAELYQGDGRLKMAQSLQEQHPDLVSITEKWGRFQHHVNYRLFSHNKLVLTPGVTVPAEPNEYGMTLRLLDKAEREAVNAALKAARLAEEQAEAEVETPLTAGEEQPEAEDEASEAEGQDAWEPWQADDAIEEVPPVLPTPQAQNSGQQGSQRACATCAAALGKYDQTMCPRCAFEAEAHL